MNPLELGSNFVANAGVPFLGNGFWLILFGTVFVSVLEAVLLQRWYAVRPVLVRWTDRGAAAVGMADELEEWSPYASLLLLGGNLVSASVGWIFLTHSGGFQNWVLGSRPLERAGFYLVAIWAVAFLLSVFVEWPFFSKAIKDKPLSREGLIVCLGCNVVSYLCILAWFAVSGMTSLLTRTTITDPVLIASSPYAEVYYVDSESREVWCVWSNGSKPHPVGLKILAGATLSAEKASNGHTKLLAVQIDGSAVPLKDLGPEPMVAPFETKDRGEWDRVARYVNGEARSKYTVSYSPDPFQGMSIRTPSRIYKLAIDSTPLAWSWTQVTVLPNNQAIGQLGPQIVLVDLESGSIGVLARGESPTVVLEG
jgi:hypothetical protein